jgi:hypothetical protein
MPERATRTSHASLARRRRRAAASARRTAAVLVAAGLVLSACWVVMIRMPGASYAGPLAPLGDHERELEASLRRDVEALAGQVGDRSAGLSAAADVIDRAFTGAGYHVARQRYEVAGHACDNVEVEIPGGARRDEIVVVGAHYDSVAGTTGADDNGSGTAALLALARAFSGALVKPPARTLRFVAFANEEPPHFQTPAMGSVVYARRCRERGEQVVAMLSLESIGFYSDRPGSQRYPFPFGLFYPTVGDFVAFVGDVSSRALVRETLGAFRASTPFPSEGVAAPGLVPGVGWSDHWAFWQEGYPAVMITDTAPFRNPDYHTAHDTPDRLSYSPMARVVAGVEKVVAELVGR